MKSTHKKQYLTLVQDTLEHLKKQQCEGKIVSKENFSFFSKTLKTQSVPTRASAPKLQTPPPVQKKTAPLPAPLPQHTQKVAAISSAAPPSKDVQPVVKEKEIVQPVKPTAQSFGELKTLTMKVLPELKVKEATPDDTVAKQIAYAWKESVQSAEVALFYFDEKEKELLFLQNVIKAVHTLLRPAVLIDAARLENEKKWDLFFSANQFKWILITPSVFEKTSELKKFYKEIPQKEEKFLNKTPVLRLSPLQSYLQDPTLKQMLWKKLCQILK